MISVRKKIEFYKNRIQNYEIEILRIQSVLVTPNLETPRFLDLCSNLHQQRINIHICREQIAKLNQYQKIKK